MPDTGRRKLVLALGAVALAPPLVLAAERASRVWRIGFLGTETAAGYAKQIEGMRAGLRDYGFIEGKNLAIDFRWANGQRDLYPQMVSDLIRQRVDVLVSHGIVLPRMAQEATREIPIVVASMGADPVEEGLVASLSRPGGNMTGRVSLSIMLHAKHVELIKETVQKASRIAVLRRSSSPIGTSMQSVETASRKLGLDLKLVTIDRIEEFDAALSSMKAQRIDALIVWNTGLFVSNAKQLAEIAIKHRMPMVGNPEFAESGALLGYGASIVDNFRRVGYFVDRIAKGANPATMPIEQPTTFELVVNLKTAKALGITLPPSVLVRAERVIQ